MITADTITESQITDLLHRLEADYATVQIATGYFASGGPVGDAARVRRARQYAANILNRESK